MNAFGAQIGKYNIVRELGKGASAKVYLADDSFDEIVRSFLGSSFGDAGWCDVGQPLSELAQHLFELLLGALRGYSLFG